MNPLDILILLIVLISIGAGVRRGFIIGLYDIIVAVIGLIFAALSYELFAAIPAALLDLSQPVNNLTGFFLACTIIAAPAMFLLRPILRRFRSLTGIIPGVHPLDRLFGVIPGAVQGVVIAFVIVLATGFFSTSNTVGGWLEDSQFGLSLYRAGAGRVIDTATNAGFDPSEFFALTRRSQVGSHVLPFKVSSDDLRVSPEDEAAMLDLLNSERTAVGLPRLDVDAELTAVARLHGIEMFNEGYFSHQSPNSGTPFDRLDSRGITYQVAGENLAFAPTVERAHDGLMDSDGHRANILEGGYRRVGIGVIVSDSHGMMFVQVFAS